MSQEIEIEFKNLLTKDEYDLIHDFLGFDKIDTLEQTNYYFETDDLRLKGNGAALRIRMKQDNWELTLKEPHPDGLLETNDTLTAAEASAWVSGDIMPKENVFNQLSKMGINADKIKYRGKLVTKRKEKRYQQTTVVLDYSQYNGTSDYELELETDKRAYGEMIFEELLKDNNISKTTTPNKIQRFYASLQNR